MNYLSPKYWDISLEKGYYIYTKKSRIMIIFRHYLFGANVGDGFFVGAGVGALEGELVGTLIRSEKNTSVMMEIMELVCDN